MTDAILQAYREVEQAMERYTLLLEEQVAAMRTQESSDASKLERMTYGARAMRDSSMIYLSYAKFIAHGMPDSEDLIQEDLQG
ncbi:MAG: hypothetical protein ACREIM_00975 [Nitrospiraceae bacterium]